MTENNHTQDRGCLKTVTSHMKVNTILKGNSTVPSQKKRNGTVNKELDIPNYFFLTFISSNFTLCSFNITCDFFYHIRCFSCFFLTFNGSFFTFDSSILILCSSNITCDSFFVTFGGSLTFLSHLTVSYSHYAVLTSYVIVILSHSVIPFLFSHI